MERMTGYSVKPDVKELRMWLVLESLDDDFIASNNPVVVIDLRNDRFRDLPDMLGRD